MENETETHNTEPRPSLELTLKLILYVAIISIIFGAFAAAANPALGFILMVIGVVLIVLDAVFIIFASRKEGG